MRAVLALAVAVLLAFGAVVPHVHGGPYGSHSCPACVSGSGEEAASATPDLAPPRAAAVEAPLPPEAAPVTGAPLGAVPGQSPPLA
ncbi:MAG TPA: hypothetical protein VEP68_08375 [Anaeromyxobacteraceae bacterium]|nr:hypothetical protein [Anaeromyxobacteraceae bacterium]